MTKAFGAATEAVMVDRGKLRWNDRVLDRIFPGVLSCRIRGSRANSRSSISWRSEAGFRPYVLDRLQPPGFAPDVRIGGLRHVAPITSFRSSFAYQNILHLVAGRIVAKLAGEPSWEDAVTKLILRPLRMNATSMTAPGDPVASQPCVWPYLSRWQHPPSPLPGGFLRRRRCGQHQFLDHGYAAMVPPSARPRQSWGPAPHQRSGAHRDLEAAHRHGLRRTFPRWLVGLCLGLGLPHGRAWLGGVA